MNKAIIGKKLGMTQIFSADGKVIPVTVVEAGPCPVVQIKTKERDGYEAIKVGFEKVDEKALNKPEAGLFKKLGIEPCKVLKEFRVDDLKAFNEKDVITVETFAAGDKVDVVGYTKGHGFSGVIKRWNQHRLMATHGVGPVHREVGSMGANSSPSRINTCRDNTVMKELLFKTLKSLRLTQQETFFLSKAQSQDLRAES